MLAQRRGPRLHNDPDRYIRMIKGQFEVRPYCKVTHQRHNLGRFPTMAQARKVRDEFLAGLRPGLPRYVKRVKINGKTWYLVSLRFAGEPYQMGPYPTPEQAKAAVAGLLLGLAGPLYAPAVARRA